MKKELQLRENEIVQNIYQDVRGIIDKHGRHFEGSLRSCQATVYSTFGYDLLYSYNTLVAVYDRYDGIGYDFLRLVYGYTATSSQHINKFLNERNCRYRRHTYRPV